MGYNLQRLSDKRGDHGFMSEAIEWNEDGSYKQTLGSCPVVGCSMRVGNPFGRTYSSQDWWLTTIVTEIIKEIKTNDTHYVLFKTQNNLYEWWTGIYPKS
jgi:hypothetical protein